MQQVQKRAKLLEDSDEEEPNNQLNINEAYAARFKHNKERAELHRLEDKYGTTVGKESEESSTDDGTEDEDGDLANELVDAEITATLKAIRSKDPRIYSKDSTFYAEKDVTTTNTSTATTKPVFLRDYHRQNLLENGGYVADDEPLTYAQEQDGLKNAIIRDINATVADADQSDADDEEFLVKRERRLATHTERPALPDPKSAEKDPETFLSNFFAARAWVPSEKSEFQPLESDDEDEDAKAEELEYAWNLRFEDPETSNKSLTTHSRDIIAKYSVRRDEPTGRQKLRQVAKDSRLQEQMERQEEKKRYKNLKIRQMEDKLDKIREAAGITGTDINIDEWTDLLEGDWDDDTWNKEMTRRFGAQYYAEEDAEHNDDLETDIKLRKPHWKDDIDIMDLDPDFEDKEQVPDDILTDEAAEPHAKHASTKAQKSAKRSAVRRDRRIIEALAEQDLSMSLNHDSSKAFQPFRYRETSPNTFGLTSLDILAAEDAQLNQFVGLKKLATFRDPQRKKLDKKKLSKKARLRAWRKETFGKEEGPAYGDFAAAAQASDVVDSSFQPLSTGIKDGRNMNASGSKRKRKKKSKAAES